MPEDGNRPGRYGGGLKTRPEPVAAVPRSWPKGEGGAMPVRPAVGMPRPAGQSMYPPRLGAAGSRQFGRGQGAARSGVVPWQVVRRSRRRSPALKSVRA